MNQPWKLIVLLVGIFLAGAASGTLVTMRVLHRQFPPSGNRPPPSAELWTNLHLKRISEDVGLRPGQLEQIKPIVVRRMDELYRLRDRFLEDNRGLRLVMEREVAERLSPEQRAKYEAINKEYHDRAGRLERGERLPPRDR